MRISFRAWLLDQSRRDDPVGDLARDVSSDKHNKARSAFGLRQHLFRVGAFDNAFDALRTAEHEWKGMHDR